MMKKRKLGIIGGSGLYKMEVLTKLNGRKSNRMGSLQMKFYNYNNEEICFIPRHGRGHKINPTNINFRQISML